MKNRSQLNRLLTAIAIASQLAVVAAGQAEAAVTETYVFHDSFAPNEGAGNVLVPVSNGTGTILTAGDAGFTNGAFVTETISSSACASTPSVRAWSFPEKSGLRHDNTTPTVVTGSYSISMLMRFSPMDGGYGRLIDFSNSTLDTGIYKLGNGVSFFPVGFFAAGSFVSDQDVFVTITRDAATQLVSLFINGAPSGTYSDTGNIYAPLATAIYFLMDNTTGSAAIGETDPGTIAYLQVSDSPLTSDEVVASLSTICDVVAATPTPTVTPTPTLTPTPTAAPTASERTVISYFLPKSLKLKLAGAGKDSLTAAGSFDDGNLPADLTQPITIEVGSFSRTVTLTAKGPNAFAFKDATVSLAVKTHLKGSSRGSFKLKVSKATLAGLIDPAGTVELHFHASGLPDALGVVTLTNGAFTLGKVRGDLVAPAFFPSKASIAANDTKPDALSFSGGFGNAGPTPSSLGDVHITVGDTFDQTIAGSTFTRKGNVFSHSEKGAGTALSVSLDFGRGIMKVKSKGIEVGTFSAATADFVVGFGDGDQPVRTTVRLGGAGAKRVY